MINDRRLRSLVGALCIAGTAVGLGSNALADDYNNPSGSQGSQGYGSTPQGGSSVGGSSSGMTGGVGQFSGSMSGSDAARGGGPTATLSDAQITAVTAAANAGEIQQGQLALRRSTRPEVRQFAQMMIDQHQQMTNDQRALTQRLGIAPAQSQASQQVTNDGRQHLARLRTLRGDAFDRAYVDIQVMEHQQVLTTLDTQLIPNATNPELRQALTTARGQVAQHLQHAQQLQTALGSQPQGQVPGQSHPGMSGSGNMGGSSMHQGMEHPSGSGSMGGSGTQQGMGNPSGSGSEGRSF